MKKFTFILFYLLSLSLFAQPCKTIKSIEETDTGETGVYYKDLEEIYDKFEGTYEYNGNDFYFKIILKKVYFEFKDGNYTMCWDQLVGGYLYKINGEEIANTLYDFETLKRGQRAKLDINYIHKFKRYKFCKECTSKIHISGWISDIDIEKVGASIFIAHKFEGQEDISVEIEIPSSAPQTPKNLPLCEFTMVKISE